MKLFALATMLAILTTDSLASARLTRRTFPGVLSDLKSCDTILRKSTSDVNAYSGSGASVLSINTDIDNLNKCFGQCINDCQTTPLSSVTTAQAQAIIDYCNNPFEPDLRTLLIALKNKRSTFTANGMRSTVQSQLNQLNTNSKAVTDCLVSKTPTALKSAMSACGTKIYTDFSDAIAYYS